jgi:hypothetical protein
MKLFLTITLNILLLPIIIAQDQEKIDAIYSEVLNNGRAYDDLRYLCKEIGPRFSGTPGAAAAVEYTYRLMKDYG